MFRVMLSEPEPKAVKMSRKKCVFVTITPENDQDGNNASNKMAQFFFMNKKPTYGQ